MTCTRALPNAVMLFADPVARSAKDLAQIRPPSPMDVHLEDLVVVEWQSARVLVA